MFDSPGKKGSLAGAKYAWTLEPADSPDPVDRLEAKSRPLAVERQPMLSPGAAHGCARPASAPR